MIKKSTKRERLSIDVNPKEHQQIKISAIKQGETIREYVLECIKTQLRHDQSKKKNNNFSDLTTHVYKDSVLTEIWDNEKDSEYDKL